MKKMMLFLAVLFLSVSATSAFALDLCLQGGAGAAGVMFQFNKVVLNKGKTTVLAGRADQAGNNVPLFGAVTLDSDGVTTRIAVMAFPFTGSWNALGFAISMVGDKQFNATGIFDNFPLDTAGDSMTWTHVLCSTVPPAFPSRTNVGPRLGMQE
jgi:hypothetical protein